MVLKFCTKESWFQAPPWRGFLQGVDWYDVPWKVGVNGASLP
jgi:hypothetical protein